ncbi:MAG TPA: SDR family NAD(P)-dependent oxidoreductase, partial [Acidimicrobiia bacterium]|nr:SDR family NAD(P)-dependent oxidoreductase [Acidimicrobiia bacterium]
LIGTPFYAAYRASKAAVAALGESLQIEVGAFGIRVVEIMPGPVATDMLAESDRLPEGAQHPGYEDLAALMYEGRKGIEPMVTPAEEAAVAIREAILDDRAPLKHGCDPLGRQILDAWRANPVAPSF